MYNITLLWSIIAYHVWVVNCNIITNWPIIKLDGENIFCVFLSYENFYVVKFYIIITC